MTNEIKNVGVDYGTMESLMEKIIHGQRLAAVSATYATHKPNIGKVNYQRKKVNFVDGKAIEQN